MRCVLFAGPAGPPYDYDSYDSEPEDHVPQFRMERGGKGRRGMRGGRGGMGNKKGRKDKGRGKRAVIDSKKREHCLFYMQGKCHRVSVIVLDIDPFLNNGLHH